MKKYKLITCMLLFAGYLSAQNNLSALLPMPNQVKQIDSKKDFIISDKTTIQTNLPEEAFCIAELKNILQERTGKTPTLSSYGSSNSSIHLMLDPSIKGDEHYLLSVSEETVTIKGATQGAILYGLMTLDQILLGDVCRTLSGKIAPVEIDDQPRFGYRSLMLDPARHFLPSEDVKFYIDQMVRYKYNVLQLHLTDDQGWRIEIKKHPRLTEKGEFYTQEELKDLVHYAAERNVQIIPELDIPGHTVAVLDAYPELGCSHTDTIPKIVGETVNLMLCANNDKVYSLYKDILTEVASIFLAPYIHLGGDEAIIETNWGKCEHCQSLMKQLGYTKPTELMNYFFGKILPVVRENGKKPMLWCELDNIRMPAHEYLFDYPKDAVLITWRYGLTPLCMELTARHGNTLIMAPGEYTYLDYPQYKNDFPEFNNWGMPVTTLETTYQFDPGYGLPASQQAHIAGVNGTLWAEAMPDINRVTYMTYPRGLALAEAGWTQMEHRDWESFKKRIYPNLSELMKRGVSVRVPFEIVRYPQKR
jgi:hypothetical protein